MAVAIVQHTASLSASTQLAVASGTTGTITPSVPSTTASTSVVVAAVYIDAGGLTSATITTPGGWNLYGTSYSSSNLRLSILWATGVVVSSQAFSLAVGTSGAWYAGACLVELSGASTTAPIDPNSGFMTPLAYSTTGVKAGANLAASIANTLCLGFFFTNDDYQPLSGAYSGSWTELLTNPSTASLYASVEAQSYNSIPGVGTAVQSGVTVVAINDDPTPTLLGAQIFVSPPSGTQEFPGYDGGMAHYTGGMAA